MQMGLVFALNFFVLFFSSEGADCSAKVMEPLDCILGETLRSTSIYRDLDN